MERGRKKEEKREKVTLDEAEADLAPGAFFRSHPQSRVTSLLPEESCLVIDAFLLYITVVHGL